MKYLKITVSFLLAVVILISFSIDTCAKSSCISENSFNPVGNAYSYLIRTLNELTDKDVENGRELRKGYSDQNEFKHPEEFDYYLQTETWICNEITLESDIVYNDPFNDVDVDLQLWSDGRLYKIPGFWDGGNVWKIRFYCPKAGNWLFKTVCTDKSNICLDNKFGSVICRSYSGNLKLYKHGFITTAYSAKYFTYADKTPFLYLGDTHWSLGDETLDMVRTICSKRASQGFTAFQSEPIGAEFDFTDGVSERDISGLRVYDEKFKVISENGLVHANSQFFFPGYMESLINQMGGYSQNRITRKFNGKKYSGYRLSDKVMLYLEKISRYWVARYGSYPVIWTLGQEVDTDFYWNEENGTGWNIANNPYLLIAEYIEKYDCYCHPLSAHQENAGMVNSYGNGKGTTDSLKRYSNTSPSLFRDMSSHNWYAAQWSPDLTGNSNYKIEKDYWYNSQGKPVIDYEGRYCYLWTKNFGSRMQGWASYLNGMFGYGWGGHDTWSYLNVYDEENDSFDGVDTVSSSEKISATWKDSLEYPSSYQSGYMLSFFSEFEWWNLRPRFNCRRYFKNDNGVYSIVASNHNNNEMVIYFYSFSDPSVGENPNTSFKSGYKTGEIRGLMPLTEYRYKWFNPVSGQFSDEYSFISGRFGNYIIGDKIWNEEPVNNDMVFYMYS